MHLKMLLVKCWLFSSGLNVLSNINHYNFVSVGKWVCHQCVLELGLQEEAMDTTNNYGSGREQPGVCNYRTSDVMLPLIVL